MKKTGFFKIFVYAPLLGLFFWDSFSLDLPLGKNCIQSFREKPPQAKPHPPTKAEKKSSPRHRYFVERKKRIESFFKRELNPREIEDVEEKLWLFQERQTPPAPVRPGDRFNSPFKKAYNTFFEAGELLFPGMMKSFSKTRDRVPTLWDSEPFLTEVHLLKLTEDGAFRFTQKFQEGDLSQENSWFYMGAPGVYVVGQILKKINETSMLVQVLEQTLSEEPGQWKTIKMNLQQGPDGLFYRYENGMDFFEKIPIVSGNPEWALVFSASKSHKKILNTKRDFPRIPRSEEIFTHFSGQTQGIDKVDEWIAFAQIFREQAINPYKTHIDYFADQIEKHVGYVEREILSLADLPLSKRTKALFRLKSIEASGAEAIREKRVTYLYWLELNRELSSVLSEEKNIYPLFDLVDSFPFNIVFPTIEPDLGTMVFNRVFPLGIYPVGLTVQPLLADGLKMPPDLFFNHDLNHARRAIVLRGSSTYKAIEAFHESFLKEIKKWPTEKRKKAEMAYFFLTHEQSFVPFASQPLAYLESSFKFSFEKSSIYNQWIKNHGQELADKQTQDMIEVFLDLMSQIKYGASWPENFSR